jgi:Protein of unknown function (DUF664)
MVKDPADPRRAEPPQDGLGEREVLEAWLGFHRTTLLLKCEGTDDHARKAGPVATSRLCLHGLVRHIDLLLTKGQSRTRPAGASS